MLGDAVALGREIVVIALRWQLHRQPEIGRQQALIGQTNCLIPEELDGVAITGDAFGDVVTTGHRRTMRGNKMLGSQRHQVIDASDQHLGIPIFLAPDGEDVEQHRPHQVVHRDAKGGEPVGDRVIGIGGCVGDFDGQTGDLDRCPLAEGVRGRDEHTREWRMRGVPVEVTESDVDHTIGTIGGQHHGELLEQAAPVGRRNLGGRSGPIASHLLMGPDRRGARCTRLEHRLGTAHVMEMRIEHRHDRTVGHVSELGDGLTHLLGGFAGVDGDDPLGGIDERLVRESVTDQAPHASGDLVELAVNDLGLGDMIPVGDLPAGKGDGCRGIRSKGTIGECHCGHRRLGRGN